jgi:hypothetical protein
LKRRSWPDDPQQSHTRYPDRHLCHPIMRVFGSYANDSCA